MVFADDSHMLELMIDNCLNSQPSSWLCTFQLLNFISYKHNTNLMKDLKKLLNSRSNVVKFHSLVKENRDFSNLMFLMKLFVNLGLTGKFLPDLKEINPQTQIKYISRINPSFKNLILCKTKSQATILPDNNDCFLHPIQPNLLILWTGSKRKLIPYFINLMTIESFSTLPNATIRFSFKCKDYRQLRSCDPSIIDYMQSFSMIMEGTEFFDIMFEVKLKQPSQMGWLINYLKNAQDCHKAKKVSINSSIQVPATQESVSSEVEPTNVLDKMTTSNIRCIIENSKNNEVRKRKRNSSGQFIAKLDCLNFDEDVPILSSHGVKRRHYGSNKNNASKSIWEIPSSDEDNINETDVLETSQFSQLATCKVSTPSKSTTRDVQLGDDESEQSMAILPKAGRRGKRNQILDTQLLTQDVSDEIVESSQPIGSQKVKDNVANHTESENASTGNYQKSDATTCFRNQAEVPKVVNSVPPETPSKVSSTSVDRELALHFQENSTASQEMLAISTPTGVEREEFTSITLNESTNKTSMLECGKDQGYDVITEGLKLLSDNLINKLKLLEFNVLKKRNELQEDINREFKIIEEMQKQKLAEIKEYYRKETEKMFNEEN